MFVINGERWEVYLVNPNDPALWMDRGGGYALGVCNDMVKSIFINNQLWGEEFERVLCHEIVHAAMFAYDVFLSIEEEELLAEVIATFGEEIVDVTDTVFDKIRRGRY
jgi:hypothetical protein